MKIVSFICDLKQLSEKWFNFCSSVLHLYFSLSKYLSYEFFLLFWLLKVFSIVKIELYHSPIFFPLSSLPLKLFSCTPPEVESLFFFYYYYYNILKASVSFITVITYVCAQIYVNTTCCAHFVISCFCLFGFKTDHSTLDNQKWGSSLLC